MIKLITKHMYHGPNPYASGPVLIIKLEIPASIQERAHALATQTAQYSSAWFENTIDPDLPADLYIGRFLASWSLAVLNRERGYLHEAGAAHNGSSLELWLGYHDPKLTYAALATAVSFFIELGTEKLPEDKAASALEILWKGAQQHHPDFQAKVLMSAARHAGIPYSPYLRGTKFWQFGWGENALVFFESRSSEEPRFGADISNDKALSKIVMSKLGVPIARHTLATSETDLGDAAAKIGWPCVAKPLDAGMAKGVTIDIRAQDELLAAFRHAKTFTNKAVMVETHLPGDVYRLLVVRGKLLVAVRRECPFVIADGHSSVRELVGQLNERRSREGATRSLKAAVPEDDEYLVTLSKQGLAPESIAEAGRKVLLRRIPFQNVGGINTNVTKIVHRDIRVMAESLSKSLGIQIAGLDYITEDISKSYHEGGAVVEINLDPALPPMVDDMLSEVELGRMVLGDKVGRIPLDLLLVQPDKLPEYAALLHRTGNLGWTCDGQIGIGETVLDTPKQHMVHAVDSLLKNRTISSALIVATLDDITQSGLPVDRVDRVLAQDQSIDKDWRHILDEHSEQVLAVTSTADVLKLIGQ